MAVCCSAWQCVAVRDSALQCAAGVAVRSIVLQCIIVSALQCVAVRYSVLQCGAVCCSVVVWCSVVQCVAVCCSVLQCAAVCCSLLQYVTVFCSVLQCVAVCCSYWDMWHPLKDAKIRWYWVATSSRLLPNIGLFCRTMSLVYCFLTKETYVFREPTNRSHPIQDQLNRRWLKDWWRTI